MECPPLASGLQSSGSCLRPTFGKGAMDALLKEQVEGPAAVKEGALHGAESCRRGQHQATAPDTASLGKLCEGEALAQGLRAQLRCGPCCLAQGARVKLSSPLQTWVALEIQSREVPPGAARLLSLKKAMQVQPAFAPCLTSVPAITWGWGVLLGLISLGSPVIQGNPRIWPRSNSIC